MDSLAQRLDDAGVPRCKFRSLMEMAQSLNSKVTWYNIDRVLALCAQDEYRRTYYRMEEERVNATTAFFNQHPELHAEYNQMIDYIVSQIEDCDPKDGTAVFKLHAQFPLTMIWKDERIWQTVFKKQDYVVLEYLVDVMPSPPIVMNGVPFLDYLEMDSFAKENFSGGYF